MNYDGTIGEKYPIRMTLVISSEEVEGVYFYVTQLKDIRLEGHILDGSRLMLDELNLEGKTTAKFEGQFVEQDPKGKFGNSKLQCEVIVGSWRSIDKKVELPVYLSKESATAGTLFHRYAVAGAEDDELIHKNALRFWNAVKRGDKKTVAALIKYPINVVVKGGIKNIGGPKELLSHYDKIFSTRYRDAIAKAIPRNMFVRYDGIMLGDGQVWFGPDGKVIALNNF
jgi:hypothetical protein